MKYKTLFRVLLKVLGVYFVVNGANNAALQVAYALTVGPPVFDWSFAAVAPAYLVSVALGLYLFFGARWVVDKAIPGNRPYCQECGYDLTGAAQERCPECGTPFKREDVRPATLDEPKIM